MPRLAGERAGERRPASLMTGCVQVARSPTEYIAHTVSSMDGRFASKDGPHLYVLSSDYTRFSKLRKGGWKQWF